MNSKRLLKKAASPQESFKENLPCYIMIAPFILLFILFLIIPIAASVMLSLFDFDMVSAPRFIGFTNYFRMFFDDEVFVTIVKNTLVLALITGPVGFALSFVLAWFLNEFKPFMRTLLSFMFYCPALVGNAYFIWQVAFSSDSYGYMNSLLLSAGFITEPINWLKDAAYVTPIIIVVQLWMSMGVGFLANISGLQNVNAEMYEAGAIDGIRNRWQELWYITLPSLGPQLLFSAVMSISSAFGVGTVSTALCGFPSTDYAAHTIMNHLEDYGNIRFEMGYASTIAAILFAMMLLSKVFVQKLIKNVGR